MQKEYPREGCGVMLGNTFYPCRNASYGAHEFLIDDRDWIKAQMMGEITGIVHSHPFSSAVPSEYDIMQAKQFNLPYHIISMIDHKMETYIP
jgi:proteasome lid subunit RPN8/RPN11